MAGFSVAVPHGLGREAAPRRRDALGAAHRAASALRGVSLRSMHLRMVSRTIPGLFGSSIGRFA